MNVCVHVFVAHAWGLSKPCVIRGQGIGSQHLVANAMADATALAFSDVLVQPNTPYGLLPILPMPLLRLIGIHLGTRCPICEECQAVSTRNHGVWEWACLQCGLPLLPDGTHTNIHAKHGSLTANPSSWTDEEYAHDDGSHYITDSEEDGEHAASACSCGEEDDIYDYSARKYSAMPTAYGHQL